jgi:hypothetical protein
MLDLLLIRAQQAARTLYAKATAMPNPYELQRLKRGDQFCDLMLDAIAHIDTHDGRRSLTSRRDDIVQFGELLAFTLWQLEHRQLSIQEYYNLLADECN